MTLKQIEYFLKFCELGNVSKTANEFEISQSALSNSLKELENSLNGNLFDRFGKNLIINRKGKEFLDAILPIFINIKQVEEKIKYSRILKLNLLASHNTGNYLLPPLLYDLRKDYNLILNLKNTNQIIKEILDHKCDLGIIENNIEEENIFKLKICTDELVVVCGDKSYKDKELYIDEIANEKWILRESGSGTREMFLFSIPKQINLNVILEINSTETIKRAIIGQKAFSVLPKFVISKEIYEVRLKNIKLERDLSIIFHKKKQNDLMQIAKGLKEKLKTIYKFSVPFYLLP